MFVCQLFSTAWKRFLNVTSITPTQKRLLCHPIKIIRLVNSSAHPCSNLVRLYTLHQVLSFQTFFYEFIQDIVFFDLIVRVSLIALSYTVLVSVLWLQNLPLTEHPAIVKTWVVHFIISVALDFFLWHDFNCSTCKSTWARWNTWVDMEWNGR